MKICRKIILYFIIVIQMRSIRSIWFNEMDEAQLSINQTVQQYINPSAKSSTHQCINQPIHPSVRPSIQSKDINTIYQKICGIGREDFKLTYPYSGLKYAICLVKDYELRDCPTKSPYFCERTSECVEDYNKLCKKRNEFLRNNQRF